MRLFRRRRPQLPTVSLEEALKMIPVKNPNTESTTTASGEMSVRLRMPRPRGVLQRLLPVPEFRTFILDKVGGFVWENIDGERNVREIANLLVRSFKMTREEAEISLLRYLQMLSTRGLIYLRVEMNREEDQRLNQRG
ncbi:Coenzyme PQQ synthesis protein D [Candidatus Calditenuaceae archaeon HR02]|nr:Coenzyme PQQ synthesis protein D [Candidatus Calditenuaceae archaeon HR02]